MQGDARNVVSTRKVIYCKVLDGLQRIQGSTRSADYVRLVLCKPKYDISANVRPAFEYILSQILGTLHDHIKLYLEVNTI
jgi:hypothetical protein